MTSKLLTLVHSKIALAVIGVLLVGGSGAAVAAATHGQLNLANSSAAQATHTPDSGDDSGDHAHTIAIEGKLMAYDANGQTISVQTKDSKSPTTIKVDKNTRVNGEHASKLDDLTAAAKNGANVQVQATKQNDGSLLAWKITVQGNDSGDNGGDNGGQAGQHAAIVGTVVTVGTNSFTVKLPDGTTKTVTVSSSTEFEGAAHHLSDLKAGMHVAVQGTNQSDGTIAAAQVEAEGE